MCQLYLNFKKEIGTIFWCLILEILNEKDYFFHGLSGHICFFVNWLFLYFSLSYSPDFLLIDLEELYIYIIFYIKDVLLL